MAHLHIPVLEITEAELSSLTIVCAELQCIANNFTMKNIDMRNSVFIGHVLILLQVQDTILHLSYAYLERLFAMMQKIEVT